MAQLASRLGERLRWLDKRLSALDRAAAGATAGVRPQLEQLRQASEAELDEGLDLLDELTGKLTLVAFSDLAGAQGSGGELAEVQLLLRRLEALASASREVAAVGA